jgi:hypothetical protein
MLKFKFSSHSGGGVDGVLDGVGEVGGSVGVEGGVDDESLESLDEPARSLG